MEDFAAMNEVCEVHLVEAIIVAVRT